MLGTSAMRDDIRKGPCPVCGHEAEWSGDFVMGKWGPLSQPTFACPNDKEPWHQEIDYTNGKIFFGVRQNESLWAKIDDLDWLIEAKRKAARNPVQPKSYRDEQEKEIIPFEKEKAALVLRLKAIFKAHCDKEGIIITHNNKFADDMFSGD